MNSLALGIIGIAAVFTIVFGLTGAVRLLQKLQYRVEYHDYTFEPLAPMMLPHRAVHHFEEHTPRIESLGFRRIGDFQLQPHPCPVVARFFVGRDGKIFAGLDDYEGIRSYSFFSVLHDGTYLETGKSRQVAEPRGDEELLRFECIADGSLDEVYRRHCQTLEKLEKKHGPAFIYDSEEFREVVSYGHRLVHDSIFNPGSVRTPPPFETIETLGA